MAGAQEAVTNLRTVRAFSAEPREASKVAAFLQTALAKGIRDSVRGAPTPPTHHIPAHPSPPSTYAPQPPAHFLSHPLAIPAPPKGHHLHLLGALAASVQTHACTHPPLTDTIPHPAALPAPPLCSRPQVLGALASCFNNYLDLGAGVLILWYGGSIAMSGSGGITVGSLIKYQVRALLLSFNSSPRQLPGALC